MVSLSDGADSAAVTCLVSLSLEMPLAELGAEAIRTKLAHLRQFPESLTPKTLAAALLTTAYQATANSGEVTRSAARTIAEAVGATHLELDVEAINQGYLRAIETALGRKLDWQRDDLALQNIQARVRSPGIWLIANLNNALLLSTSNRSEAAVGYATMDGDTSGGLSPIAGIDKAFLRQWLRWLETKGPEGLHTIPALSAVNQQAPTAELRPADRHQTDEDDLMPYEVLDAIECAASLRILRRSKWGFGWNDSSSSGAGTNGNASVTRRRFTWTMKTLIRRRGAGSRFCRAGLKSSWRS